MTSALRWGGVGLGLLAIAWPARLQATSTENYCRPGTPLHFEVRGVPWWVQARVGSQAIPVERQWSGVSLRIPDDCAEGSLPLHLEIGGISPQVLDLPLVVDKTPPQFKLQRPGDGSAVAGSEVAVAGGVDSPCQLSLDGTQWQSVSGNFKLSAHLKPGWNEIDVKARDQAGNQSSAHLKVFSDTQPPGVVVSRLTSKEDKETLRGKTVDKDSFRVRLEVQDDSGPARLRTRLDGGKWATGKLEGNSVTLPLRGLAEGTRLLEVEVTDKAGRKALEQAEFVVDSSEKLGTKVLTLGAKGEDVRQLQSRLNDAGQALVISGLFDENTEMAVRNFQEDEKLPVTGKVAQATLAALGPRVFVNLGRFELVLDRPGEELRRYTIACGAPSFPTPTGSFKVADMTKDPSWLPPDSPWAKGAEPIPPGPGNPLGTRWIGLDWGGVGIHGTNADWSIGSASSHGCVRMHISDVEDLYELLGPGTPVTILGGWEKDPAISRYWP